MSKEKESEFDIIRKIREQTLQDVVTVESVTLSDKGIKIKVSENDCPVCTLMCTNKPNVTFINAANYLKPYVNTFKQYNLPNEYQLNQLFEETKKQKFREIRMDKFTEADEKQLKEEILNKPSIEKLFIESVELKSEKKEEMEIFFFLLKVQGLNPVTGAMEKDEVMIYRDNIPRIIGDKQAYEDFRDSIEEYIHEARKHYFAFIKMQELERENTFRRNVLAASQGRLFKLDDLSDFDRNVIGLTAREYFPDKFLGEAETSRTEENDDDTEETEEQPKSHFVGWSTLEKSSPMAESVSAIEEIKETDEKESEQEGKKKNKKKHKVSISISIPDRENRVEEITEDEI